MLWLCESKHVRTGSLVDDVRVAPVVVAVVLDLLNSVAAFLLLVKLLLVL